MNLNHPKADNDYNHHKPHIPEVQLICAILYRGIADRIICYLKQVHKCTGWDKYSEVRSSVSWLEQPNHPYSAKYYCELAGIDWSEISKYLDHLHSIQNSEAQLREELAKFRS